MTLLSDALRILVVGSGEECLRETECALGRYADRVDLRWVSQADLAPLRAADLRPHLVLVYDDIGPERLVALSRELPTVTDASIVAVVAPEHGDLARRAVLAGVRGFFVRPLSADHIASLMAESASGHAPRRHRPVDASQRAGRVIVFCSPKGGTGRTTLAVNTAISLHALSGESVVIVDADYASPAIDVALNLHDAPDVSVLLERLGRLDAEIMDAALATHASGVRALLAPPPSEDSAPRTLPEVEGIVNALREVASWVIVDLGPPMDERAQAFLVEADLVVVNVVPEAIGLRNAGRLLEWLWERGMPPELTLVVLNRADLPVGLRPEEVGKHLAVPIAFEIPDDQALATESVNRGAPIVLDGHHTAVAEAVREFARRLIRQMTGVDPVAAKAPRRRRRVTAAAVASALALISAVLFGAPDRVGVPFPIAAAEPETPTLVAAAPEALVPSEAATSPEDEAAPTATRVPTAVPSPTSPPTPQPTAPAPADEPAGEPTAEPTEAPPPTLLEPASGAVVDGPGPLVLAWEWARELPEDARFAVTLAYRFDGATRYVEVPATRERALDAAPYLRTVRADGVRFHWSVRVVQGADAERPGAPLCPMSQVRTFTWEGAGG